jgi:hypothetical protein
LEKPAVIWAFEGPAEASENVRIEANGGPKATAEKLPTHHPRQTSLADNRLRCCLGGPEGLAMVGMGYGFVSGWTAGGVSVYWPPADYGRVAGRTYIAWCLAAVSLPVLAGYLFDMTREYSTAVLIAAGANVAGMAMALTMPRHGWRESG